MFYFADPALLSNLGHHAMNARAIVGELRRRGVEVQVLANVLVTQELQDELGAKPVFRVSTYCTNDGDPIAGWLNAFAGVARATVNDLFNHISQPSSEDVIYVNSGGAAQLEALVAYLDRHNIHGIIEFGTGPGLHAQPNSDGGYTATIRHPAEVPVLLRHVATSVPEDVLGRLHMVTFDRDSSDAYAALMGLPVGVLPLPRLAGSPLRNRAKNRERQG